MANLTDKEASTRFRLAYEDSVNFLNPYYSKWARYDGYYRSYTKKKIYTTQANLFIPLSYATIEHMLPRVISSTMPNDDFVDIVPLNTEKDQELADKWNVYLPWRFRKMDYALTSHDTVKSAMTYGLGIQKVVFENDVRKRMAWEQRYVNIPFFNIQIPAGWKRKKKEKTLYHGAMIHWVDPWDFIWDTAASNMQNCTWAADRCIRSYPYLEGQQKLGNYKNLDQLTKAHMYTGSTRMSPDKKDLFGAYGDAYQVQRMDRGIVPQFELWEMYDKEYETVCTFVTMNGKPDKPVVIRNDDGLPYMDDELPYIRCVSNPLLGEFVGQGEIQPIEQLQLELNDKRSMRMDQVNLIINGMYKVRRDSDVDVDELYGIPGGVVFVDYMDDIERFQQGSVDQSAYMEENILKMDWEMTTALSEYRRGTRIHAGDKGSETATEATLMAEAANARFVLKAKLYDREIVTRTAEKVLYREWQSTNQDFIVRTKDKFGEFGQPVSMSAEEFRDSDPEKFEFVAVGSLDQVSKSVKIAQLMKMYEIALKDPTGWNITWIKEQMLREMGYRNAKEILQPSKEQMAMINAIQGMAGGQAPSIGAGKGTPGNGGRLPTNVMDLLRPELPGNVEDKLQKPFRSPGRVVG